MDIPVVYIFINSSLNMKTGKIASQAGHAVQACLLANERAKTRTYSDWLYNGATKIVCKATSHQMTELAADPDAYIVRDQGRTEVEPGSMTAVAFGPLLRNSMHGRWFQNFSLL